MHQKEYTGSIVRATARPESDPDDPREWSWVEASVWTDRMLAALDNGVRGGKWSSTLAKCLLRSAWAFHLTRSPCCGEPTPKGKLLTGELCAGEPHAQFGGRGGRQSFPTPIFGRSRLYATTRVEGAVLCSKRLFTGCGF